MRRALLPIVCLFMTSPLLGQTSQPTSAPRRVPPSPSPRPARQSPPPKPSLQRDSYKIATDLGMDKDQRTAMKAILELIAQQADEQKRARARAMATRSDELTQARRDILVARRARDDKRVVELKEIIDEIRGGRAAVDPYEVFFEKIGAILTDEQKALIPEIKGKYPKKPAAKPPSLPNRTKVSALVRSIELTDEQKEAVDAVEEAFTMRMTAAPIFDPVEYHEFKLDFVYAMAALLSDEQRKVFEDKVAAAFFDSAPAGRVKTMASRPRFMYSAIKKLGLSELQAKQVTRVEKAFAERIAKRDLSDIDANQEMRRDLKIALGRILTDEQLEKFEKAIEQRRAEWTRQRRAGKGATTKPADGKAEKPKPEAQDKPKPEKPKQDKPEESKPDKP